jgi:two-component system, chemotaxis family, sensor histidine kinase and response regulator PixL
MAINPDIRDQAYQFFIQEAPELLQAIESGLLTLQQEHNTAKVHNLMRAAHSIKGGASSVGLDAIATLAHRLENIFKALYSDSLTIDAKLEDQLLQAYDCLRLPLMLRITMGSFDAEQALAIAEPIFSQIEEQLGDALTQTENYIPSSSDLGIDMISSILEIDVAQGLERLAAVVANPQNYEVAGELRAQVEVFAGFAELMNLSEFGAIAATVKTALDANPNRALEITKLAMADFERSRQAALAGGANLLETGQSAPSAALTALTMPAGTAAPAMPAAPIAPSIPTSESAALDAAMPLLQNIFGDGVNPFELLDLPTQTPAIEDVPEDDEADLSKSFVLDRKADTELLEAVGDRSDTTHFLDQPDPPEKHETGYAIDPATVYETIREVDLLMGEAELVPRSIPHPTNLEEPLNVEWVAYLQEAAVDIADTADISKTHSSTPDSSDHPIPDPAARAEGGNLVLSQPPPHSLQVRSSVEGAGAIQSGQIQPHQSSAIAPNKSVEQQTAIASNTRTTQPQAPIRQGEAVITPNLTVRVASERLERMNNLVGELAINRDGLSLQNEQLQTSLKELLKRFARFRDTVSHLRELSDQMLVEPERHSSPWRGLSASQTGADPTEKLPTRAFTSIPATSITSALAKFDPLEMDSYGTLHTQIQEILEDIAQLEETVDDVSLFAGQSNQILDQQRSMLTQLRDELIWSRMFPLGEVINRFPRMIRDLSTTYHKPVALKLSGAGVLVDKAILEKLFDPLLHLLRNAFDHGIEPVNIRRQRGKPEQGQIEIRAYHKGNQTIIQVRDDGQGLDLNRVRSQAIALGWLDEDQAATLDSTQLYELIFEPGFSTARQVTELSGRGVGLDVVRSQLRSIKGTVTVTSTPGRGTVFTLYLPLTLTIAKLVICLVGSTPLALPADSIEEILNPQPGQVQQSGAQRYLNWREQIIPTYRLSDLLSYSCPLPENSPSKALSTISLPKDWALPMLVLRQEQQTFALEVDRLVTEQELVIKPFGLAIAPPSYAYGCTILGDGSLVPVIDGAALLALNLSQPTTATLLTEAYEPMSALQPQQIIPAQKPPVIKTAQSPTVLIIDDSATLRRTAALSLERAGFRVMQARDGREAIDQLQHTTVQIIVCDIEMPNMNGFEFLSLRRKDAKLAATPVVMLTSRSNEKHRWLANQLGASAYFTKPYLEQEFITTLKNMINTSSKALPAIAQ